jgi:hypothetical protein
VLALKGGELSATLNYVVKTTYTVRLHHRTSKNRLPGN